MGELGYFVDRPRISIKQYPHAVLDLESFFFCQCIFPSFD
jgi:hypothetical protein